MSSLLIESLLERGHLSPFTGNMFDVAIFGRDQSTRSDDLEFEKAYLRCSSITLGSPELKYKGRHPLTKQQLLDGVQFVDTVTITWLEDQLLSVWNYHRTWMSYFYNRETDQFQSGTRGKRRVAEIYLQEMKDISSPLGRNVKEGAQAGSVQHFISLEGLMPTKLPELSLGWGKDDSASVEIQLTYRVDNLRYQIKDNQELTGSKADQFRSRPGGIYPNASTGVEV